MLLVDGNGKLVIDDMIWWILGLDLFVGIKICIDVVDGVWLVVFVVED